MGYTRHHAIVVTVNSCWLASDPDGPPIKVAAIVPDTDPIMNFMRGELGDPDHVEVRYFDVMRLEGGRVDAQEWASSLETFAWAYGGAVRWVCPD